MEVLHNGCGVHRVLLQHRRAGLQEEAGNVVARATGHGGTHHHTGQLHLRQARRRQGGCGFREIRQLVEGDAEGVRQGAGAVRAAGYNACQLDGAVGVGEATGILQAEGAADNQSARTLGALGARSELSVVGTGGTGGTGGSGGTGGGGGGGGGGH